MTISSFKPCALDTMLIVYSLLREHPASNICEQLLRANDWFTTVPNLLEAHAILLKVYGADAGQVQSKLAQLTEGPVAIIALSDTLALAAMQVATQEKIDLTDAVLMQTALERQATFLATCDQRLAQVARQKGLDAPEIFDFPLRRAIAHWEEDNLSSKGLPRVLRRVHSWLEKQHPTAASDFWSHTGGGSHLP